MTIQQCRILGRYADGDRPLNRAIRAALDDLAALRAEVVGEEDRRIDSERRSETCVAELRAEIHRLRDELQCCRMETAAMVMRARGEMTPAEA